jgi:hypothetical protein
MHRYDGIFEITMHDKVRVGEPNILMMVNGVEKFIFRLIRIPQSWIEPLLLEQKFHFVFLDDKARGGKRMKLKIILWQLGFHCR